MRVDFAVADGHKWMLAPEGLGLFYVRKAVQECLKVTQFGWHMAEAMSDYTAVAFTPASDGRRFECGSPNMLGIHALEASLGLLLEIGIGTIWERISERIAILRSGLLSVPGIEVLSDGSDSRRSGIVTFRSTDDSSLFSRLRAGGVFCARRGGGIRLSPHCYTPVWQLEKALQLIEN